MEYIYKTLFIFDEHILRNFLSKEILKENMFWSSCTIPLFVHLLSSLVGTQDIHTGAKFKAKFRLLNLSSRKNYILTGAFGKIAIKFFVNNRIFNTFPKPLQKLL